MATQTGVRKATKRSIHTQQPLLPREVRTNLILLVRKHDCLFDHNHEDYNDKKVVDGLWAEIGQELGITGPRARTQWKNMRDGYRAQRKRMALGKRTGTWPFLQMMAFMEPYMVYRGMTPEELSEMTIKQEFSEALELEPISSPAEESIAGWSVQIDDDNHADGADNNDLNRDMNGSYISNGSNSTDAEGARDKEPVPVPRKRWLSEVEMCQVIPQPGANGAMDTKPIVKALKDLGTSLNQALAGGQDEETAYGIYIAAKMRSIPPEERQRIKLQIEQLFTDIHYSSE